MILSGDEAIVIATMLHEITLGPLATREAMRLTEEAGLWHSIELVTDAKNLLLALAQHHMKPPAEKSFFTHLLWLRQKLEAGVFEKLRWCDTRDMTGDGHTKGSVPRDA